MLSAGLRSEELREATRRYFAHQVTRATPTINAAIERGELPPELDIDAVLTSVRAPLFYRVVTTGDRIDDALVEQTVRITLAAARAGLLSST